MRKIFCGASVLVAMAISLIAYAEPGRQEPEFRMDATRADLPIRLGLEKPHDLRPEFGLVCPVLSVTGKTAEIGCGKSSGVDSRQDVSFVRREDYASGRPQAKGLVSKLGDSSSIVTISGKADFNAEDVVAVTAAWRSERARENKLWRVAALGINLLDYPSRRPFATIDELRFDVDSRLEQAAVIRMIDRLQDAAVRIPYSGTISKGRFHGKTVSAALRGATPQDVMDFLGFLITYPDNYVGRDWLLAEVYATWLLNGAPKSSTSK